MIAYSKGYAAGKTVEQNRSLWEAEAFFKTVHAASTKLLRNTVVDLQNAIGRAMNMPGLSMARAMRVAMRSDSRPGGPCRACVILWGNGPTIDYCSEHGTDEVRAHDRTVVGALTTPPPPYDD